MRLAMRSLVAAAAIAAAVTPLYGITGRATAGIAWNHNGLPCGNYGFASFHTGTFLSYTLAEGLWLVQFQGRLEKNYASIQTCSAPNSPSIVRSTPFSCSINLTAVCPSAQGTWASTTSLQADGTGAVSYSSGSSPVYANCFCGGGGGGGGGCDGYGLNSATTVFELETGRQLRLSDPESKRLADGFRRDTSQGKEYIVEQWAIFNADHRLVSSSAPMSAADWLGSSPDIPARTGLLVVQQPVHRQNMALPLVRLDQRAVNDYMRSLSGPPERGEVIISRLDFSAGGRLQANEVLQGNVDVGTRLGELVSVEFTHAHDHRVIVFAAFQIKGNTVRLTGTSVIVPQCCCGEWFCV